MRALIHALAVFAVLAGSGCTQRQDSAAGLASDIHERVGAWVAVDDIGERVKRGEEFATYLRLMEPERRAAIDEPTIDQITELLADDRDDVRSYAAAALGMIGPPAAKSLPALDRALKEVKPSFFFGTMPELSSDGAIRLAIFRISGKYPPD